MKNNIQVIRKKGLNYIVDEKGRLLKFKRAGFKNATFYVTSAEAFPFDDALFNIVLCILSLNFIGDIKTIFQEIKRVTTPGAVFICSVPVPKRNKVQSTIRGRLYSETELKKICKEHE